MPSQSKKKTLRSQLWFDDSSHPDLTSLYLERYLNYGLTLEELRGGKPMIGIAQTGSDLSPCNRHHLELAKRVREGIREAGGICFEFPVHPIQETGRRPTPSLDRNLAYLGLVELLHGYPLDGVVLTIGCDKTTPACLMAAATTNLPAIALSVGPMLNGWYNGKRTGSGTIVWEARELLATGEIDYEKFIEIVASSTPSPGYCNTMGTATTMNSLAEALGMQLPGSAAIPAPYRQRAQMAYETGRRIVAMVHEDLTPDKIMTRQAFENAIVVNSAIGGSTNAPIHINAIAAHLGVSLDNDDWDRLGHGIPLLTNLQPAGEYLGEDYYRAGGVPAVIGELIKENLLPHPDALTVTARSVGDNCVGRLSENPQVIRPVSDPLMQSAGFVHLKGNLFDSAIMKTSVISSAFRERYLSTPGDENAFEARVAVFDGPEDYVNRIDEPNEEIDEDSILVMRGTGPLGYPGAPEVVNMRPPNYLIQKGISCLPCLGDGRQSGTSASPSILHASPEAAAGGGLAILRNGDVIRIDLNRRSVDVLLSDEELEARRAALAEAGGYRAPETQTPWQDIFRRCTGQLDRGMVLTDALRYRRVTRDPETGLPTAPRHSH